VDAAQRIVITGMTFSSSLPGVPLNLSGLGGDAYVTYLAPNGQSAAGTAFATEYDDLPADLEIGLDGGAFLAGCLMPASSPEDIGASSTAGAVQPNNGFAARL